MITVLVIGWCVLLILLGVAYDWIREVEARTLRLIRRVEWLEERQPKIEGGRIEWPSATGTNTPAPIEWYPPADDVNDPAKARARRRGDQIRHHPSDGTYRRGPFK